MQHTAFQCEHCGSTRVVSIVDDLWKCNDCDEFFDSDTTPREEKIRRKAYLDDDNDEW